eukprot:2212250-Pyramimonas_sp.AAC.1
MYPTVNQPHERLLNHDGSFATVQSTDTARHATQHTTSCVGGAGGCEGGGGGAGEGGRGGG